MNQFHMNIIKKILTTDLKVYKNQETAYKYKIIYKNLGTYLKIHSLIIKLIQ